MLATSAAVMSPCPGHQFEHSCDHTESQGADLAKNQPLSDFRRNDDNIGVNNILSWLFLKEARWRETGKATPLQMQKLSLLPSPHSAHTGE